jgi:hypothetical protein
MELYVAKIIFNVNYIFLKIDFTNLGVTQN